jgi:hypothetical protein
MELFNSAVKSLQIENAEQTIGGFRISKAKSLTSNINGVIKSLTIHNLPEGYKAVIGIQDNDTIKIKDKKIYGKYYIKVYDIFNREIPIFANNYRIATGLDITMTLSNIDTKKALIKSNDDKVGYFDAESQEFKLTIHNDNPITIESTKASSPDNADPSTWWVIGGIIVGVIVISVVIFYLYSRKKDKVISASMNQSRLDYTTPRFPQRYVY